MWYLGELYELCENEPVGVIRRVVEKECIERTYTSESRFCSSAGFGIGLSRLSFRTYRKEY